MNKKEFARRAMEIVEICIEKDIHYELDLDSSRNDDSICVKYTKGSFTIFEYDSFREGSFVEMKKLVEEY